MCRLLASSFLLLAAVPAFSQSPAPPSESVPAQESTKSQARDGALPAQDPSASQLVATAPANSGPSAAAPAGSALLPSQPQPKRILGVMPNFVAVSAGAVPPPPTPRQAFLIATRNSFDYSAFALVGLTSALAEKSNAHPQLGNGLTGFERYYWRGFLDKTDGNYLVLFALPTVFHQDERYYAKGCCGIRRLPYALTRILIARNYSGRNGVNTSELLGRGLAQILSMSYYPSRSRTVGAISSRYGFSLLGDAASNVFHEFWPEIATRVLHRHP